MNILLINLVCRKQWLTTPADYSPWCELACLEIKLEFQNKSLIWKEILVPSMDPIMLVFPKLLNMHTLINI